MITPETRSVSTSVAALLGTVFLTASVTAGGPPTVLYSLDADAAYTDGCFGDPGQVPQCQCPIVDGAGPVTFDSGLVADGDPDFPPQINILIGDGFGCPGVRVTVSAAPGFSNPADVAPDGGDGVVGILDFLAVLGDWGLSGPRATDIDGSGTVGIGDLLIVLAEWT